MKNIRTIRRTVATMANQLSQHSYDKYMKEMEKEAEKQKSMPKLLEDEVALPNPTQEFTKYKDGLLRKLPEAAILTYEQQYFELERNFPDFAVWANHREHERLERQIDIGFREMVSLMERWFHSWQSDSDETVSTLEYFRTEYEGYINRPVIKDENGDFAGDIVFPAQKDIFVPQAFQALIYHQPVQLESFKENVFG